MRAAGEAKEKRDTYIFTCSPSLRISRGAVVVALCGVHADTLAGTRLCAEAGEVVHEGVHAKARMLEEKTVRCLNLINQQRVRLWRSTGEGLWGVEVR